MEIGNRVKFAYYLNGRKFVAWELLCSISNFAVTINNMLKSSFSFCVSSLRNKQAKVALSAEIPLSKQF